MRAGPCGVEYSAFDKVCVKRETEDMPDECQEHFLAMRECFVQHNEYYGFVLDMFETALNKDEDEGEGEASDEAQGEGESEAAAETAAETETETAAEEVGDDDI